MKKENEKVIDTYIPRHQRVSFGVQPPVKGESSYHEIEETIPIVDENGSVVETKIVHKKVLASEALSPYKYEDFRLENLIAAGVPLSEVSVVKEMPINCGDVIDAARRLSYLTQNAIYAEEEVQRIENNKSVENLNNQNNE